MFFVFKKGIEPILPLNTDSTLAHEPTKKFFKSILTTNGLAFIFRVWKISEGGAVFLSTRYEQWSACFGIIIVNPPDYPVSRL